MTPDGGADTLGTLGYRVGRLESKLDSVAGQLGTVEHSILTRIDSLELVRRDLYESEKRGLVRDLGALDRKIDDVRALAMWALGLVGTTVAGAVVTAVVAAAS